MTRPVAVPTRPCGVEGRQYRSMLWAEPNFALAQGAPPVAGDDEAEMEPAVMVAVEVGGQADGHGGFRCRCHTEVSHLSGKGQVKKNPPDCSEGYLCSGGVFGNRIRDRYPIHIEKRSHFGCPPVQKQHFTL